MKKHNPQSTTFLGANTTATQKESALYCTSDMGL